MEAVAPRASAKSREFQVFITVSAEEVSGFRLVIAQDANLQTGLSSTMAPQFRWMEQLFPEATFNRGARWIDGQLFGVFTLVYPQSTRNGHSALVAIVRRIASREFRVRSRPSSWRYACAFPAYEEAAAGTAGLWPVARQRKISPTVVPNDERNNLAIGLSD